MRDIIGFNEKLTSQVDRFLNLLDRYVTAYERRRTLVITGGAIIFPGLTPDKGETMPTYTLPRDHADEPFVLGPLAFADAEGPVPAPANVTESFESDNPDVVSVDAAAGTVHFGTFGGANLTRKAVIDGNEFIVATATFNVTPGALVVTGDVSFPNLTPDA
jgi:hypothetical protein